MNDAEIYTPDAPKLAEKKGDMTSTAEKLYDLYEKARAAFRAMQEAKKAEPEPEQKLLTDVGSETKTDD
jgi:hypothetical protein